MKKAQHIVWKTRFELRVRGLDRGREVQGRATELLREAMVRCLAQLWDEQVELGHSIRLERVELELGKVRGEHWEEVCIRRLEERLRDKMETWEWETENANPPEASQKAAPNRSHWEWLDIYLRQGTLPWWAPEIPEAMFAAKIQEMFHRPSTASSQWLRQWLADSTATTRLLEWVELSTLAPHLPPGLPPVSPPAPTPVSPAPYLPQLLMGLYPFAGVLDALLSDSADLFVFPLPPIDALTHHLETLLGFPWQAANRQRLEECLQNLRDHWEVLFARLSQLLGGFRGDLELSPAEWQVAVDTFIRLPGATPRQQALLRVQVVLSQTGKTHWEAPLRHAIAELQLEWATQTWASPWVERLLRGVDWPLPPETKERKSPWEPVLEWLRQLPPAGDLPVEVRVPPWLKAHFATWSSADLEDFIRALQLDPQLEELYKGWKDGTNPSLSTPTTDWIREAYAESDQEDRTALRELLRELRSEISGSLPALEHLWDRLHRDLEAPEEELAALWEEVKRDLEQHRLIYEEPQLQIEETPELLDFIQLGLVPAPEILVNLLRSYLSQQWASPYQNVLKAWLLILDGPGLALRPEQLRGLRLLFGRLREEMAKAPSSAWDQLRAFSDHQLALVPAQIAELLKTVAGTSEPASQPTAFGRWISELESVEIWKPGTETEFRSWLSELLQSRKGLAAKEIDTNGHTPAFSNGPGSRTPWEALQSFLNESKQISPLVMADLLRELDPGPSAAALHRQFERWITLVEAQGDHWTPEVLKQVRFWLTALEMGRSFGTPGAVNDEAQPTEQEVSVSGDPRTVLRAYLAGNEKWAPGELAAYLELVQSALESAAARLQRRKWIKELKRMGKQWRTPEEEDGFRAWLLAWNWAGNLDAGPSHSSPQADRKQAPVTPDQIPSFLAGGLNWSPRELAEVLQAWLSAIESDERAEEIQRRVEHLAALGDRWEQETEVAARLWLAKEWKMEQGPGADEVESHEEAISAEIESKAFRDFMTALEADLRRQMRMDRANMPLGQASSDDKVPVANAGLVLLGAFLPHFLDQLGYLEDRDFSSESMRYRAALLLELLVREFAPDSQGQLLIPEFMLPLNKALCGIDPRIPLPARLQPRPEEVTECTRLLESACGLWEAAGSLSPGGLRAAFLQRPGLLSHRDGHYLLQVETRPHDILLERLPWGFSLHKHPWMPEILKTEWKSQ